jgi:hypothetical protein
MAWNEHDGRTIPSHKGSARDDQRVKAGMIDPYDTAVVLDTWSLGAAEGDRDAAGTYVTGFARRYGMDEGLLPATHGLVSSVFAGAVDSVRALRGDSLVIDAATDGEYLTVRIAAAATSVSFVGASWNGGGIEVDSRPGQGFMVTVELPMLASAQPRPL